MSLYPQTRLFTGKHVVRAYLHEVGTNRVVWTCQHNHRSRLHLGGKNGAFYAMRCAEAELRRRVAPSGGAQHE